MRNIICLEIQNHKSGGEFVKMIKEKTIISMIVVIDDC